MPAKEKRALVTKIIKDGPHGPYAVASSKELGSVTFSLDDKVWEEDEQPEPGTFVMLSRLIEKNAGWRARSARFANPDDVSVSPNSK